MNTVRSDGNIEAVKVIDCNVNQVLPPVQAEQLTTTNPIQLGTKGLQLQNILKEQLAAKYTEQTIKRKKCCFCGKLYTAMMYIACLVKFRGTLLLLISFIPPLIKVYQKPSKIHPNGNTYWDAYFDNHMLTFIYMINVIFCFFCLCYNISVYYSWLNA